VDLTIQLACDMIDSNYCEPLDLIWERRRNLTGVALVAVSEPYAPYADFDEDGKAIGAYPEIYHELQTILGFSSTVVRSIDGFFGTLTVKNCFCSSLSKQ